MIDSLEDRRVVAVESAPPMLTPKQAEVLSVITSYHRVTGEGCRASYLARRLSLTRNGVLRHTAALYRKGWLRSESSPFSLRRVE